LDGLDTAISYLVFTCVGLDTSAISEAVNIRTIDRNTLQSLSKEALLMTLWFISAFAEEGGKKNSSLTSTQYARLNESFSKAMRDIVYLINFALTDYNITGDPQILSECRTTAMSALSATKYFYMNICTPTDEIIIEIKSCLAHAIAWVNVSRLPDAIRELVELLSNDRIFDDTHYSEVEKILTSWGREQLREDILNEVYSADADIEGNILGLLLAYGDSRLAYLLEEASTGDDPSHPGAQPARVILGKATIGESKRLANCCRHDARTTSNSRLSRS
jgi:hypothetical protein